MSRIEHIRLLADYNEWMNVKLYEAAAALPADEVLADRKAFFGSIFGTLGHIARADTIWLKRFATHPSPPAVLDAMRDVPMPTMAEDMFADFAALTDYRRRLDRIIGEWARSLAEHDLDVEFAYSTLRGAPSCKKFFGIVMHFFNHQTHHRGQATTLFSQAGVDVGSTDLLVLVPEIT